MKKLWPFFCVGAVAYPLLEMMWRGWSHWSMSLAGGLALSGLAGMERRAPHLPLRRKCLRGALWITLIEFVSGCVCNKLLKLNVWDYSHLPANLWGQVCPAFTAMWFLLCIPVCGLLQRLRKRGVA